MKQLYINLFNGRVHKDEQLEDWGFQGPLIGPLAWIQTTYGHTRYAFASDHPTGLRNALAFGFSEQDYQDIDLEYENGCVKFDGFLFGDWNVQIYAPEQAQRIVNMWLKVERMKALSQQALFMRENGKTQIRRESANG